MQLHSRGLFVSFTSAMSHLLHPHIPSAPSAFPSSLPTPRPLSTDTEPLKLDGFTRKANVLKATAAIVCVSKETKLFFSLDQPCSSRPSAPAALRRKSAAPRLHFNPSRTVVNPRPPRPCLCVILCRVSEHVSDIRPRVVQRQTKAEKV